MRTIIIKNDTDNGPLLYMGWGNGYVIIPKGHLLHGMNFPVDIDVHGGITYRRLVNAQIISRFGLDWKHYGDYIVGFDTGHFGDTVETWPEWKVIQELQSFHDQLEKPKIDWSNRGDWFNINW